MKNTIKTSVGIVFSVLVLVGGLFAVATPADALTCNDATLTGTVTVVNSPTWARFVYSTNYNTVANSGGNTTASEYFYNYGTQPIEAYIAGLSENTTYYYRLIVSDYTGNYPANIEDFTTPYCQSNYDEDVYVDLSASDTSIDSGDRVTLSWDSDNADYCDASWSSVSEDTDGNDYVYPTSTRTYSITCYGDGDSDSDSVTVYVEEKQQSQPTVDIYANPTTTSYGGSSVITWNSTDADYCYASGGSGNWSGDKRTSGTYTASNLTLASRTYTITCKNNYGSASDSVTVYTKRLSNPIPVVPSTSLVLIDSSVDRNQPIVPTIDNTRPCPGDEINYAVTYQNAGTSSISNLVLRLDLPYGVNYVSSSPNNPNLVGNVLTFNLGSLRANGQGIVMVKVRVQADVSAGAPLNFPATLSYTDSSGYSQTVNTNAEAQVCNDADDGKELGGNVLWAGFFPTTIFGWLLLVIFALILALLAKYVFSRKEEKTTTTTTH